MRRISGLLTLLVFIAIIAVISYYLITSFFPSSSVNNGIVSSGSSKAALIDALYATIPNDEFTGTFKTTLTNAEFEVDVFQGSEVTVDFLGNMSDGYDLIVLRMHSALDEGELFLFTAEPYSVGKHTDEQYFRIAKEAFSNETSQSVFAVNWGFVKRSMAGVFNNTLVVAMGCDSSGDSGIIEEFMNQGAAGYVSWSGPVLITHSDFATLQLLQYLYSDQLSAQQATQKTNEQLGPDPNWDTVLKYYAP